MSTIRGFKPAVEPCLEFRPARGNRPRQQFRQGHLASLLAKLSLGFIWPFHPTKTTHANVICLEECTKPLHDLRRVLGRTRLQIEAEFPSH